jgi:hypothetical protein
VIGDSTSFGNNLANDGTDNIGQYLITFEKTIDNVLASHNNLIVVFIELRS